MTCSRCGVRLAEERASLCARCLLLIADADDPLIDAADHAPPCELLSIIGETERALTFLGEQTWPVKRLVALKLFKRASSVPLDVAQVLRPAPGHPAIAPVLESGSLAGQPYIMTPFVGGGPVAHRYTHSGMPIAPRLHALLAVAEALVVAHGQGVAHGRLVGSNLLCAAQAPFAVQITDFQCNARKVAALEQFDTLARDDVAALAGLAALLLDTTAGRSLSTAPLERLQQSVTSALEFRHLLEDLQAQLVPSRRGYD